MTNEARGPNEMERAIVESIALSSGDFWGGSLATP